MNFYIPLNSGIALRITTDHSVGTSYPTSGIQKGMLLLNGEKDLSEEAVGFGVPILKCGMETIFPGEVELYPNGADISMGLHAKFRLNLVEELGEPGSGSLHHPLMYKAKNLFANLIRSFPLLRGFLTSTSSFLRSVFEWQTIYAPSKFSSFVSLSYFPDPSSGKVKIEVESMDPILPGSTELILMNEQGARYFDEFRDSDGTVESGNKIGCWDQVHASEANFISREQRISFSLPQSAGAKLFRGRELLGTRLAWSGFGYSFSPHDGGFSCVITIKRLP